MLCGHESGMTNVRFVDLAVCQFDEERAALLNDLVL